MFSGPDDGSLVGRAEEGWDRTQAGQMFIKALLVLLMVLLISFVGNARVTASGQLLTSPVHA